MNHQIEVDTCVIGAGPVGAALACSLAAGGVRVAVVDRAPLPPMEHPDFDGRAYAIAAGSRALLEAAGVWARLPFMPCPILDIRVSDGKTGRRASPLFLHFDHAEAAAGPFGWMVEARSLRVALNARLHELADGLVFAPAEAVVTRSARGRGRAGGGRSGHPMPVGGRRGRAGVAAAGTSRDRRITFGLPPSRDRQRHRP